MKVILTISENQSILTMDFSVIANTLLNYSCLVIANQAYRIIEIEFYLCTPSHPDPYVHKHPLPPVTGTLHFHKHPNGTYKGGTYKGVDFVWGGVADGTFMVLIRSMMDAAGQLTTGPCKVVDLILASCGHESIISLVASGTVPYIVPVAGITISAALWWGSRVGLSDKYSAYRDLPYRYAIHPDQLKIKRWRSLVPKPNVA